MDIQFKDIQVLYLDFQRFINFQLFLNFLEHFFSQKAQNNTGLSKSKKVFPSIEYHENWLFSCSN